MISLVLMSLTFCLFCKSDNVLSPTKELFSSDEQKFEKTIFYLSTKKSLGK